LDMPKIDIRSDAKPSTFAYPDMLEEKKSKEKEKVETAVLSTTAKQLGKWRKSALKIPPTVLPKIGKTRTKILANLYESYQKSFHPKIPLTLLCDPFYNRTLPR